jgi:hypothetical protein
MSHSIFALSRHPTPLLNTPDFASSFQELPLDEQNLLRSVEVVAFPGVKFRVLSRREDSPIVQVATQEYPYEGTFFTDSRFLAFTDQEPEERDIPLPSTDAILAALDQQVGTPYIWGGNWPEGIPQLCEYYPSSVEDEIRRNTKLLRGVDCTGMLYFATQGYTPRNTSAFVTWGNPVAIAGHSLDRMCEQLQPLDAIVWRGHLVCVYDRETAIESLVGKGVVKTPLRTRLEGILTTKLPADEIQPNCFVVRRWVPEERRS